jgi:putative NADH-flavin reductase
MRLTVFGANGATGRVLVRQALDAGHEVAAVTRRPADFPFAHPRLLVAGADVRDGRAVTRALDGSEAVLSSLGVPFTRRPVTVYSEGVAVIAAAMSRLGVKRIVVVSSTTVEPHHHAEGGFMLNRVMQPLISRTIGKTTYADMRVMEDALHASDLDWTVVRPAGLFDAGHVSSYQVSDSPLDGVYTSREDLAACLLAQASDSRFVKKAIELTTSEGVPTLWQVVRREAFKKN